MIKNNLQKIILNYTNTIISIFYNVDANLFLTKHFNNLGFFKKRKLVKIISKINLDEIIKINEWVFADDLNKKSLRKIHQKLIKFHKTLIVMKLKLKEFEELFDFINEVNMIINEINDFDYAYNQITIVNNINKLFCLWIE